MKKSEADNSLEKSENRTWWLKPSGSRVFWFQLLCCCLRAAVNAFIASER